MSTPEESFETAVDESSDDDARRQAISQLETANDCDRLSDLVRTDDVEAEYRERALEALANPQCRSMLQSLVDSGDVPESLTERAETLLDETADDAGAGP